jgi:hypothetical protein
VFTVKDWDRIGKHKLLGEARVKVDTIANDVKRDRDGYVVQL